MVFTPPSYLPQLPEVPDSITIEEFLRNEQYGRYPVAKARNPYTCGITGTTYNAAQVAERIDYMARAISKRLGLNPNEETEWERVVALYSVNTIDYLPFTHAIHRLSGIVTPASAAYSIQELEHQLRTSGAKALFTCPPLLENALKAANAAGIPKDRIFILRTAGFDNPPSYVTIDDLVAEGKSLPPMKPLNWVKGQGARQTAYLCYSSGTSGLPKAVMVSHRNVIANVLQVYLLDSVPRKELGIESQVLLGVLPFSHIYALVLVSTLSQYRGDETIVLPKYNFHELLDAVQRFKIEQLFVVPPMLIQIIGNPQNTAKYNLESVRFVYCGAAPLGPEVVEAVTKMFPKWRIGQGYGMTECSPTVSSTNELDVLFGSSGSLLPGKKAKVIDLEGKEVTEYDTPGELLIQSPAVVLGYLNNEKANAETFVHHEDGRWLRTGDEVVVRKSAQGHEHLVVVDRIKELIKTKGHQVAPAELEAHLLSHPYVSDCAVIPVPDSYAGEVPKAFVTKSVSDCAGKSDKEIEDAIQKHVKDHKAKHKWLNGGIEFIDAIPKSPSGKILRRLLRDKEKKARQAKGAKL
ncbi:4-coumarate--CoA ligase [Trichoderma lentiforme]|uniref:4-coumarate--CoA ligase n=1 Tax=Trichoderma lentiforme TaxID=1567552 RepID=A0A9P5CCX9_9HYPO|nr:4-coumarate--CoA ligase [Trichoderma lentiforme]